MRKHLINIALLVFGLISGAGAFWLYMKSPAPEAPKAEMKEEGKILFYRHPMNPEVTSPTPKKDEMGMDYVPVYEEELAITEVSGAVRIGPEKVQKLGVKSEEVRRLTLKKTVRTVGRVDHDETAVFNINTKVEGWVEKLYVNKTDQMVHPGDALLTLYSPELVATQEEYLLALKTRKNLEESPYGEVVKGAGEPALWAGRLVTAARKRLKYLDISDEEIKRLEEEGNIARTMTVYSPSHGIVTEKTVTEGMKIEPGQTLFEVIDHSRVWVYGEVYEYELPFVKVGQKARIIPSYTPAGVYTATLSHIYTHTGEARHEAEGGMDGERTVKVRFTLQNPGHKLKLGMYVNVELDTVAARNALAVPDSAVIDSGTRRVVIIDRKDGTFEPRDVIIGALADNYYEILEGVKEGERVVTSANFLIDSESNLRAALKGMEKGPLAGH